jgi:hypothetical protein
LRQTTGAELLRQHPGELLEDHAPFFSTLPKNTNLNYTRLGPGRKKSGSGGW